MKQKLYCYSAVVFKQAMEGNGWTTKKLPDNVACIEICATPDVLDYYGDRFALSDKAWFMNKKSSPLPKNVLKLHFDDITEEVRVIGDGKFAWGIKPEQARQLVDFIDENIDKDFYIHCHAGKSRSQAVVQYVLDFYKDHEWETRRENPCYPALINYRVFSMLKRAKEEKEAENDQP